MSKIFVKNGEVRTRTGVRRVALGPDFFPRPVDHRIHSGYQPDRCTVQVAESGDFIFEISWDSSGTRDRIYRLDYDDNNNQISNGHAASLWDSLKKEYPSIDGFLNPVGRGASFLPEDLFPEEKDLCNFRKEQRIERFEQFSGIKLDRKLTGISPSKGLNFQATDLQERLALGHNPSKYIWTGTAADINTEVIYYWCDGYGQSYVAEPIEGTILTEGSNYAGEKKTEYSPTKIGLKKPNKDARFLIRICTGAYVKNHCSYGITVDVYRIVK